jgi:hypothetical protein
MLYRKVLYLFYGANEDSDSIGWLVIVLKFSGTRLESDIHRGKIRILYHVLPLGVSKLFISLQSEFFGKKTGIPTKAVFVYPISTDSFSLSLFG